MTQTAVTQVGGFRDEQVAALSELIHEDQIKDRAAGGGRRLKYIKGDTAIDAANRIFGYGQWGYKVIARGREVVDDPKKGKIDLYTADIELSVVGAAFTFPGDGVGIVNDPFTAEMHEKARKEAVTDAIKRALRHYGDQFGLSLYNEDDPIEARDGSIKPVKAAVVQNHPQPQERRVIDAAQNIRALPHPQQSAAPQPEITNLADQPINSGQMDAIRLLCKNLGRNVPDGVQQLDFLKAKGLIQQLTSEWNVAKQKQQSNRAAVAK